MILVDEDVAQTLEKLFLPSNTEIVERKENINKVLNLMSQSINYISHPSITSGLECNINFKKLFDRLMTIFLKYLSEKEIVNINSDAVENLLKSYLNVKFERINNLLVFKDVEALKILYVLIVIINKNDHPLYNRYLEWVKGENSWMEHNLSLLRIINY
jgi:hypothetical protein